MGSNLKDHPARQIRNILLEGRRYNRIRLAMRRLGAPIRLSIPGRDRIAVLIEPEAWVVVDCNHNDRPLMAIRDFERARPNDLLAPIRCRVYEYSVGAGEKFEYMLEVTERLLEVRLSNCRAPKLSSRVVSLIPHPPR